MLGTIEDLQDESAPSSQFTGMTQLHPIIPFKFERTDTAITFTNYLGDKIRSTVHDLTNIER